MSRHKLEIHCSLNTAEEELLYDPQTSGGLVLSVPGDQADDLISTLHDAGVATAVKIDEVTDGPVGLAVE